MVWLFHFCPSTPLQPLTACTICKKEEHIHLFCYNDPWACLKLSIHGRRSIKTVSVLYFFPVIGYAADVSWGWGWHVGGTPSRHCGNEVDAPLMPSSLPVKNHPIPHTQGKWQWFETSLTCSGSAAWLTDGSMHLNLCTGDITKVTGVEISSD